jgi:hypothetical protein
MTATFPGGSETVFTYVAVEASFVATVAWDASAVIALRSAAFRTSVSAQFR